MDAGRMWEAEKGLNICRFTYLLYALRNGAFCWRENKVILVSEPIEKVMVCFLSLWPECAISVMRYENRVKE